MNLRHFRAAAIVVLALLATVPFPASAQTDAAGPETVLAATAGDVRQVEIALDGGRIGSSRLEEYRATLEARRQELVAAAKAVAEQLDPLRTELEVLGPAPADGAEEPSDIAAEAGGPGRTDRFARGRRQAVTGHDHPDRVAARAACWN